jgi:hypothetical protein
VQITDELRRVGNGARARRAARALALLVVAALAAPLAGAAPKPKPKGPCQCKDLPAMEQELFEQEWLQREFYEYALGNKAPPPPHGKDTTADSLKAQVLSDFIAWRKSPAGGRTRRGGGAPALGVNWGKCQIVTLRVVSEVNPDTKKKERVVKERPFDEPEFRSHNCQEVADAFILHEQEHVKQCGKLHDPSRPLRQDPAHWLDSASFDVEAYGEFVKAMRKSIADLASRCGWQGSTNATKKNPVDQQDVDVVPTEEEAKRLASALAKGKK